MNSLIDEGMDAMETCANVFSELFAAVVLAFLFCVFAPFGLASRLVRKVRKAVR